MARISATVVVVAVALFFFSVTLCQARIPVSTREDEVTKVEVPNSLPESAEVNSIIRLPSYSGEDSQFHSIGEFIKELSKAPETSNSVQSVPLNVVTFRPVNHPFRFRSRISRLPFRDCRHHHRFFMPTTTRLQQQRREIPYGDDMIMVNGENADSDQAILNGHGHVRRVWPRLVRIHHHHHHGGQKLDGDAFPQLMFKPSIALDEDKLEMNKHHQQQQQNRHQHHHYRIHENEVGEERKVKEEEKENHGGFMKNIRKILFRV